MPANVTAEKYVQHGKKAEGTKNEDNKEDYRHGLGLDTDPFFALSFKSDLSCWPAVFDVNEHMLTHLYSFLQRHESHQQLVG